MALDRRGMDRDEWALITAKRNATAFVDAPDFRGYAGLMRIDAVSEPFVRGTTLADAGYAWLQLAPAGEHWWLTVMYDPDGALVQYYFDITMQNGLADSGEPFFEDLYLDVVMGTDGALRVLDRDELDQALAAGEISPAQHTLAEAALEALLVRLNGREAEWRALCARIKARLEAQLDHA